MFVLAFMAVMASAHPQMPMATADEPRRDGKSLVGVFPFNDGSQARSNRQQGALSVPAATHGHDHHHDHTPITDLSKEVIAAAGKRCIDKVVMEDVTVYDEEVTCHHSYT